MTLARRSLTTGPQLRARYTRAGANNLLVNSPDGYAVDYPPISWLSGGGDGSSDWWLGSDAGGGAAPIGPHGPFGAGPPVPAVTRATALITGPLTAAPFRLADNEGRPTGAPTPRWLTDPMLLRPDNRIAPAVYPAALMLPRGEFWGAWIRAAVWWGLGAFLHTEDATGGPTAGSLRLVDPRMLYTERDEGGALCWTIGDGTDTVEFDRDGYTTLGPVRYRITVLRNPHSPVDADGMSLGVFGLHPGTFRLGGYLDGYTAGVFRSGVPSGYLKVDGPGLTQEQADELKGKWMDAHGGVRKSVAVLNATTSYSPLTFTPVDAAIAEVKRLSLADLAFAFGLDPYLLGVTLGNSATYSNIREAWTNHRDFGLALWTSAVQDTLTALIPAGQTVAVNFDGFAAPSLAERVTTGAAAVAAGLMTADEWRATEGLDPLPKPDPVPVPEPEPEPVPEPEPPAAQRSRRPAWLG